MLKLLFTPTPHINYTNPSFHHEVDLDKSLLAGLCVFVLCTLRHSKLQNLVHYFLVEKTQGPDFRFDQLPTQTIQSIKQWWTLASLLWLADVFLSLRHIMAKHCKTLSITSWLGKHKVAVLCIAC